MVIRPLTRDDLPAVARIHRAAFEESALTWLGAGAVQRYYDWQIAGPQACVALGAWQDGVLTGYCFGGVFRGALKGFLRKNRLYLTLQVVGRPWLLLKAPVRQRLTRVGSSGFRSQQRSPVAASPSFGILSIAVDPHSKRSGVGKRLMTEMEAVARAQGFTRMQLTVRTDNLEAMHFYERLGWVRVPQDGHWCGVMVRRLS